MIKWPAILVREDDPELVYLRDRDDWNARPDLHVVDRFPTGLLVDSLGKEFELNRRGEYKTGLQPSGRVRTLEEILALVKAHAASSGTCCVAKLYAPTIEAAYGIARSIIEEETW